MVERITFFVLLTNCTFLCVGRNHQRSGFAGADTVLFATCEGSICLNSNDGTLTHPDTTMPTDVSSTFVKPLHTGSSQYTSPYPYAAGTAIPPPPPDLYPPLPSQPKRNRVHVIAITLLTVLVVGLGSLEGSAIDHTYPVSNISLRVCWIESSRYRTGSACDITSQDNTCEDTDSRDDQREQDVDVWCLQ